MPTNLSKLDLAHCKLYEKYDGFYLDLDTYFNQ